MTTRGTVGSVRGGFGWITLALVVLAAFASTAPCQDPEEEKPAADPSAPEEAESGESVVRGLVAYEVGRIFPVSSAPIDDGIILVDGGKITAMGPRDGVVVPKSARRVDARDRIVVPGFVHAASLAFTGKNRFSSSGRANSADSKVSESLTLDRREADRLVKSGFTTLMVLPTGGGLAGQACRLSPPAPGTGRFPLSEVLVEDGVSLAMAFEPGTASKKLFSEQLGKAQKYRDDLVAFEKAKASGGAGDKKPETQEEKPKEGEAKPGGSEEQKKPEEKGASGAKEEPKKEEPKKDDAKEPQKDPKVMPLVEVLERRRPALVGLDEAAAFLHFAAFFKEHPTFKPVVLSVPAGFQSTPDAWRLVESLATLRLPVVLPAAIGRKPRTDVRLMVHRQLLDAGVPVAVVPFFGAEPEFRYHLLELERHGMSFEEVLRAVTLTPAELHGIQGSCGSLEVGKDADFLIFTGEPLDPRSELAIVVSRGRTVYQKGVR